MSTTIFFAVTYDHINRVHGRAPIAFGTTIDSLTTAIDSYIAEQIDLLELALGPLHVEIQESFDDCYTKVIKRMERQLIEVIVMSVVVDLPQVTSAPAVAEVKTVEATQAQQGDASTDTSTPAEATQQRRKQR